MWVFHSTTYVLKLKDVCILGGHNIDQLDSIEGSILASGITEKNMLCEIQLCSVRGKEIVIELNHFANFLDKPLGHE